MGTVSKKKEKKDKQEKRGKKEKKHEKRDKKTETQTPVETSKPDIQLGMQNVPLTESGEPLFVIDIKPTKVNRMAIPVQGTAAAGGPPKSQLNRDERRRIGTIEKYRKEARKTLKIPEDSLEVNKELEKRVAAFTRSLDAKKVKKDTEKHARRKAKTQAADARQAKEMRKRSKRR